jgi:hypothetical protein
MLKYYQFHKIFSYVIKQSFHLSLAVLFTIDHLMFLDFKGGTFCHFK